MVGLVQVSVMLRLVQVGVMLGLIQVSVMLGLIQVSVMLGNAWYRRSYDDTEQHKPFHSFQEGVCRAVRLTWVSFSSTIVAIAMR